jgi:hypothetical protein
VSAQRFQYQHHVCQTLLVLNSNNSNTRHINTNQEEASFLLIPPNLFRLRHTLNTRVAPIRTKVLQTKNRMEQQAGDKAALPRK